MSEQDMSQHPLNHVQSLRHMLLAIVEQQPDKQVYVPFERLNQVAGGLQVRIDDKGVTLLAVSGEEMRMMGVPQDGTLHKMEKH